jgi:prophage regulatory protein
VIHEDPCIAISRADDHERSAIRHTLPLVGEVEAHAFSGHMIDPPPLAQSRETRGTRDAPIRMLRIDQVIAVTGLRKTRVYVLQAQGDFPLRVQLSPRRVGWVEAEVRAWLAARIASNKPVGETDHSASTAHPAWRRRHAALSELANSRVPGPRPPWL